MRNIEALVWKRRYGTGSWESSLSLRTFQEHRSILKKGKKGEVDSFADVMKGNPKRFYRYNEEKRVTKERIGPLRPKNVISV